ncbi:MULTISPECIES: dGTP triphosphohydrolase [unclassified Pseudomonas]|uniref:dGTP triphosphohydrolase n=1 Tax=unclassified Pseudomonas TaxID=196821 RepID=UPI00081C25C0|nr:MULTISPECIES: dNTP triphosphohydrolase [unclassified Pseudomonas]TKK28633.1 dNTP triphosphohydrolase [Pseudomonas sp. CFBP13528]
MLNWKGLLNDSRRKSKGQVAVPGVESGRYQFERDYDRILFAAPTRRLADKTQVFPLDRNDSVRTRLTHSHEVSTLARSIGLRLVYEKEDIFAGAEPGQFLHRSVPAMLAAIGLVHDLGNPPFGHQGEVAIQNWFKGNCEVILRGMSFDDARDFFGFDGNAQTVRLVTKLQILNDRFGLNLTYGTLAALIKYPVPVSGVDEKQWKKQGYFKSEQDVVDDIWRETGLEQGIRHPLTYVMEACDDIAYSVLDAEDTVKKSFASYYDLLRFLKRECGSDEVAARVIKKSEESSSSFEGQGLSPQELNECSMQMFRVYSITEMVGSVVDTFSEKVDCLLKGTQIYNGLISESKSKKLCKALKRFDFEYGFKHKSVLELELKGNTYITEVMDMLWVGVHGRLAQRQQSSTPFGKYAYSRISESYRRIFEDESNDLPVGYKEAQLLADAVSGMTDSYLIALHSELKPLYDSHCK